MNRATLTDLNTLPLYLNVQVTDEGRTLDQCADAWPAWRERLLQLRPAQRPATADVLLLNALFWPVSMLHLAVGFIHAARVDAEPRLDWPPAEPRPFTQLNLPSATLTHAKDPLRDAVEQIVLAAEVIVPATHLRERLVLHVICDRAVQALLLLGRATGRRDDAAHLAAELVQRWPVPNRTRVRRDGDFDALERTSCCFHYLDAPRCDNCPTSQKSTRTR